MITRVPIDRIFDNPFQTRTVYTEIEELAQSIKKMREARPETGGLIQVPPARILVAVEHFAKKPAEFDPGNARYGVLNPEWYGGVEACLNDEPLAFVQLAAGHRRFRAFAALALSQEEYNTFPVDVLMLDNKQMADMAWEENAKRKDLTAIEEGEALMKAIELFNYTQAQIGERWGLSQSAVANKIRLLQLPAEAQEAIRQGQITEKHGRALLAALGKSKQIYEAAAGLILPTEAKEAALEQAKAIFGQERNWYETTEPRTEKKRVDCGACGTRVFEAEKFKTLFYRSHFPEEAYLCVACYRGCTDWTVPATSEAEIIVRRAVNQHSTKLAGATWPPERAFETPAVNGSIRVRVLPACAGCPAREKRGNEEWCLDKSCFEQKAKLWKEEQFAAVRERLGTDYGAAGQEIKIIEDYNGETLSPRGVDAELVKNGICVPGKCKRLRLRYRESNYNDDLRPYKDLPFAWNCDNSTAHRNCQQKYMESKQNEDQASAAVLKKKMEVEHKRQAKTLIEQATRYIADALRQEEFKAWQQLVERMSYSEAKGVQSVEDCQAKLAVSLVSSVAGEISWGDWGDRERLERFKTNLGKRLEALGISQEIAEAG